MPNQVPQPTEMNVLYVVMTVAIIVLFAITSYLLAKLIRDNENGDKAIIAKIETATALLTSLQINMARQDNDILHLKDGITNINNRLNLHGDRIGRMEIVIHGSDDK